MHSINISHSVWLWLIISWGFIPDYSYNIDHTIIIELASLAQLLPPCLPTCVIRHRTALRQSCCSPTASASAAAPRLRLLQLLLPDCVCFSCCWPIASTHFNWCSQFVSASSAARHLCLLQLLLPDCVHFMINCSTIASASAVAPRLRLPQLQLLLRLHLQLPDCVRFDFCSPILHPSAVLEPSS